MTPHQRAVYEEHQRRRMERARSTELCARIVSELFDRQQTFEKDPSKRKAVLGSRRAGKTEMWARILTKVALENPRTLSRVWSHARLRAKELLWDQFRFLHARHGIKVETNETELSIRFPNDAIIRLVGADKDKEAQKKRGDKTIYEVVLESQSWESSLLEKTSEEVIQPSLFDLDGTLALEGTPGALPIGYWHQITGGNDIDRVWQSPHEKRTEWVVHRWTMLDNPFLKDAREKLEREKKKRRWADDNPTYLREYCGRWVNDLTALFYPFDVLRNTYEAGSITPYGKGWNHTLGWDLGSRDDMAVVIWGWHPDHEDLYEVLSWKKPGASADEVMTVIEDAERRFGLSIIAQAADTGGGGKMYVEEVHRRYSRRFTAAQKTQKYNHARLFGDDLRTGHIKLIRDSAYAMEIAALLRDPDWSEDDLEGHPNPVEEDKRCANHCADAGLYAWREAYHYYQPVEEKPEPHRSSKEYIDLQIERIARGINKTTFDQLEEEASYGFGAEDN